MATRNGQPIDLIWILFDVAGQALEQFGDEARGKTQADARTANCEVSINQKQVPGQPQAIVKVVADSAWPSTLPAGLQNMISRVYTEADHDEAVALVTSAEWAGEPSTSALARQA